MDETAETLFEVEPVEPPEKVSAVVRLRLRQEECMSHGQHPLANVVGYLPIHPESDNEEHEGGPRCGDCLYREPVRRNRTYWKCFYPGKWRKRADGKTTPDHPHFTHGPATDIKRGWPACIHFEPIPEE